MWPVLSSDFNESLDIQINLLHCVSCRLCFTVPGSWPVCTVLLDLPENGNFLEGLADHFKQLISQTIMIQPSVNVAKKLSAV